MSRLASLRVAALPATILVLAIVAGSALAGRSGWVNPWPLEAGHGPIVTYPSQTAQSWWICAAVTESREPCQ
jgi:hypothetical protein